MIRSLGGQIFSADLADDQGVSVASVYRQTDATELGFKEKWLQNAVARAPELVIDACREAGLTDERWWTWAREYAIEDVGSIDVLLVSESGRVAIVETKLSYNHEGRRSVLAQILDYAVHLPEEVERRSVSDLPPGLPVSEKAVQERIENGDFLLIVAGDLLDSRAVKLSRSLLGDHLLNDWELALVELAVFAREPGQVGPEHIIVPHLRGVIEPESRQVVKVVVAHGDKNRVVVERQLPQTPAEARQTWTRERFTSELEKGSLSSAHKSFANALFAIQAQFPGVQIQWGTGKTGSATLKRNGHGLVEFYLDGKLAFRRERPARALGPEAGEAYLAGLREIYPGQMTGEHNPNAPTNVPAEVSGPGLESLAELIRKALASAA